jgi:hypothetical protein
MLVHMKDLFSRRVLLTTLAGVEDVHLDGDSIVGRWKQEKCEKIGREKDGDRFKPVQELTYISNRMAKRGGPLNFVNITSDDQILKFTEKYGPLERPLDPAGSTFRQSLKDWRDFQARLRWLWSLGQSSSSGAGMKEGDMIYFDRDRRVSRIELGSLKRFLEFCIVSAPRAMRRVCARPGCGRYFIASRKDSHLCGQRDCANEVRKQHMRNWWTEHGKEWRARRKKKKRRKT